MSVDNAGIVVRLSRLLHPSSATVRVFREGRWRQSRHYLRIVAEGPPLTLPNIVSMRPEVVRPGDLITIRGTNFHPGIRARVGEKELVPEFASETELRIRVPLSARPQTWVRLSTLRSQWMLVPGTLYVERTLQLFRDELLPAEGEDHPILLFGAGFSEIPEENVVTLDGFRGEVVEASYWQLRVNLHRSGRRTGRVVVRGEAVTF